MTDKRKKKGLIQVKENWCKGCGICVHLCPKKVFVLDEMGKAKVVKPDDCIACKICEMHCPDFSILVKEVQDAI